MFQPSNYSICIMYFSFCIFNMSSCYTPCTWSTCTPATWRWFNLILEWLTIFMSILCFKQLNYLHHVLLLVLGQHVNLHYLDDFCGIVKVPSLELLINIFYIIYCRKIVQLVSTCPEQLWKLEIWKMTTVENDLTRKGGY